MKEWIFILLVTLKASFCLSSPHMAVLGEFTNEIRHNSIDLIPKLKNSTRIIGGYPATLGPPATAPWQVALVYGDETLFCGGTLISYQVIVTAAHCIAANPFPFTVQLGGLSKSSLPLKYQVHQSFVHEDFDGCGYLPGGGPFTCDNDIALLILDNKEDFTSYEHIEPANLPDDDDDDEHANEIVQVSGWGKTSYEAEEVSEYLMAVDMTLNPNSTCQQYMDTIYVIYTGNMICAGNNDTDTTKNSFQGDSDGPLVLRGNTSNTLLGIVSWGSNSSLYPSVYTKVTNYVSWIKNKTDEGIASLNNSAKIENGAGLILVMLFSSLTTWIIT